MRVPWPESRCILCLEPGSLTDEHVIPKRIGGKLKARFLCRACNSRLGHTVEAAVKDDPSIRIAVDRLSDRMPAVARRAREGLTYVGHGPAGGAIRGRLKRGRFKVSTTRQPDGSLVQPTPEAREHVEAVLLSSGLDGEGVARWLREFDAAPADRPVALPAGITIVKREGTGLTPVLDGPFLADQVLVKIAYEFLACHLVERVYGPEPQLAALREAVWASGDGRGAATVEHLTTGQYSPVHGLALVGSPHVMVSVCLFDWLRFRVHFHRIAVAQPNFIYSCMLDSGDETIDVLPDTRSSADEAG